VSWASSHDRGQAHAINLGFLRAEGDIMAYLNSDDTLLPGTLDYVASFFGNNPEVDIVYGHRVIIDMYGDEVGRWVLPPHDDNILKWADFVPQETLFWRRRVWDKLGSFDETFQLALDWEFLLRAQANGFRFARLPRFLGGFRVHDAQKTLIMNDVATREAACLRERYLGRKVEPQEIDGALRPFFRRQILFHRLYKFPLIKY
jgi:glycosyltransferase involved in cell wall biosynthesis